MYTCVNVYWRLLPLLLAALTLLGRPGVGEALENAVHALAEGHAAHGHEAGSNDVHDPMHLEHGCGGGVHVCPCHAPTVALPGGETADVAGALEETTIQIVVPEASAPSGVQRAVFRPPAV